MEYIKKTVNSQTGEEVIEPMTEEEIAEAKKAHEEANKPKVDLRQQALNKLIDLGLTEEEIAALQTDGKVYK